MSRRCELSGKGPMSGNSVSHANNKTRRRFLPNLQEVTLESETLGRSFRLRISNHALRSVDHRGGLDAFLAKAKDDELSSDALAIKKEIEGNKISFADAANKYSEDDGNVKTKGTVWYAISRSTMIRRWRFPKPEVPLGAEV